VEPLFPSDHKIVGHPSRAIEGPREDFASTLVLPLLAKCLVPFLLLGASERRCWGQTPTVRLAADSPAADRPTVLTVERKLGAEGCPDVDALTSRVDRIRGRATGNVKVGYQITFAHDEDAYSATIRSSPDGTGVRTLEDRGTTCAALAQATAVTLALLLDSDPEPVEPPTPAPTSSPPTPKTPVAPPAPVARPERSAVYSTLAIGATTTSGVIQTISPAISGEVGINVARWHMGLGVLAGVPEDIALGPGVVRETLLSGVARICYAPLRGDRWGFDACSGVYLGTVTAEGRNYSSNLQQKRSWLAAPFEVAVTYASGSVGLQASAAALVPLQRQNFRIDNLGVAYESWPVAAMFSLRAIGRLKW
jgi:hypothetical protein